MQAKHQVAERYIRCPSFFLKNFFKGNAPQVRIQVKLGILEFCSFLVLRKILSMGIIYLTEILFIFSINLWTLPLANISDQVHILLL